MTAELHAARFRASMERYEASWSAAREAMAAHPVAALARRSSAAWVKLIDYSVAVIEQDRSEIMERAHHG